MNITSATGHPDERQEAVTVLRSFEGSSLEQHFQYLTRRIITVNVRTSKHQICVPISDWNESPAQGVESGPLHVKGGGNASNRGWLA